MPGSPEIILIGGEVPTACEILNQFVMEEVELHDNYLINWMAKRRAQNLSNRIAVTIRQSLAEMNAPEELYGIEFVIDKRRDRTILAQVIDKVLESREENLAQQQAVTKEPQRADLALEGLRKAIGAKPS